MLTLANVVWGARCGESARRVLLGETRSSGQAYSVRGARESAALRQAPHRLPSSRLVSTNRFDLWAQAWRRKQADGDMIIVRFADDIVVGFQTKADAVRFWAELIERMRKFSLELHPEKTRLLEFGPFATENRKKRGAGKPETFNFLGFTHICGQKRGNGRFTVLRQTIRKRLQAKLSEVKAELKRRMHDPIPEVGQWLRSVVGGHIRYYGVPTNRAALYTFRFQVGWLWHRTLLRRSQKARVLWDRMRRLIERWLAPARTCHPSPLRRLGVIT